MGWYWEIARNNGQRCLHVVDTAKNKSVMELLPKQITLGEFVDRIVSISTDEKITNYDFKDMVRKIEWLKDNIKDKLLLWNGKFETSWDIARGLCYIQTGLCPSKLVNSYGQYASDNVRTKFAVVYLDSDTKTFWTLSTDDADAMLYNHVFDTEDDEDVSELKTMLLTLRHSITELLPSMFAYIMGERLKEVEKIFKEQEQEAGNAELEKFMSKMTVEEVFAGLDSKRMTERPTSYRTLLRCWDLSLKRLQEGKKTRLRVSL